MSGSTDETETTGQWREEVAKELRKSYASLTREARNIARYARQHDIALYDIARDIDRPTGKEMEVTEVEAALDAASRTEAGQMVSHDGLRAIIAAYTDRTNRCPVCHHRMGLIHELLGRLAKRQAHREATHA